MRIPDSEETPLLFGGEEIMPEAVSAIGNSSESRARIGHFGRSVPGIWETLDERVGRTLS